MLIMKRIGDRDRRAGHSPEAVHATTYATHVIAGDLDRTTAVVEGASTTPALTALGIRSLATARSRTHRRAGSVSRSSAHAAQTQQRRLDGHARREQHLSHPRTAERHAHALDHDMRSTRIAYLAPWLLGFVLTVARVGMIANDPSFVAVTLRRNFDIPDSTALWAVWDPNVLVSLAAAVVVTVMLLGGAHVLGKAFASLLFNSPLLRERGRYPEAELANKLLPRGQAITIAIIGSVVLGFFIWFLHKIAHERFTGGITAALSGQHGSGVEEAVTAFITVLPLAVVALEVVANHPVFAHVRKAARWSLQLRVTEWADIRRDDRLARRGRVALRRARLAMADLADMTGDVALRAQAEYTEGALVTGKLDATDVATELGIDTKPGTSTGDDTDDEKKPPLPRIDLSGKVRTGVFTTPVVSNRVAEAIAAYRMIAETEEIASIAKVWTSARESAIRRVEGDHSSTATQRLHPVDVPSTPTAHPTNTADIAA